MQQRTAWALLVAALLLLVVCASARATGAWEQERVEIALDGVAPEAAVRLAYSALCDACGDGFSPQRWAMAVVDRPDGQEPVLEVRFYSACGACRVVGLCVGLMDVAYLGYAL